MFGELTLRTSALAEALGIGSELVIRVAPRTATLAEVRAAPLVLDKLAEVFEETEAYLSGTSARASGLVVDSVRRATRQQPTALGSFRNPDLVALRTQTVARLRGAR